MAGRISRWRFARPALALAATTAWLALAPSSTATGGLTTLPDVDIALVIEVRDTPGWLALYEEVLGTPREAPKPLGVSVAGSTGGARWITVLQPKFATQVSLTQGMRALKVLISGKVAGAEALRGLAPFEHAVLEMQAGAIENQVVLSYGLAGAIVQLVELNLARP